MNGNQQFIVALITVGFPSLGAFIVSVVTLIRQGDIRNRMAENHVEAQLVAVEAKQAAVAAAKTAIVTAQEVRKSVDGVKEELVAAARTQGASDQRENPQRIIR